MHSHRVTSDANRFRGRRPSSRARHSSDYKRNSGSNPKPLPDFFIGAHAAIAGLDLVAWWCAWYWASSLLPDVLSPISPPAREESLLASWELPTAFAHRYSLVESPDAEQPVVGESSEVYDSRLFVRERDRLRWFGSRFFATRASRTQPMR